MKSLKLPADLRIQAVNALRARLLAALDGEGPLRVQGHDVDRLDTAGLQLLVAAALEAERRGRTLYLVSPSEPLAAGLCRLGLEGLVPAGTPGRSRPARKSISKEKANGKNSRS